MQIRRDTFYQPEDILKQVKKKVADARQKGEIIDYLTFVSDGEPTLDRNLGREIDSLKRLGINIAVLTNSSLLWDADVREALCRADWVSVKLDAVTPELWRQIDRPHGGLPLDNILRGVVDFSQAFQGELFTETMLVQGINDTPEELERIAGVVARAHPQKSYLAIPTRPPAEPDAHSATEAALNLAYQTFCTRNLAVEYLIGYEGNAFAWTGNVAEDLLSITAVHPMRTDAVQALLHKAGAGWDVIDHLLGRQQLRLLNYQGHTFYARSLHRPAQR
jgi:wyosine [tRNA(Phe)-imidazoG37] synthetase (radical SAM superfamily)